MPTRPLIVAQRLGVSQEAKPATSGFPSINTNIPPIRRGNKRSSFLRKKNKHQYQKEKIVIIGSLGGMFLLIIVALFVFSPSSAERKNASLKSSILEREGMGRVKAPAGLSKAESFYDKTSKMLSSFRQGTPHEKMTIAGKINMMKESLSVDERRALYSPNALRVIGFNEPFLVLEGSYVVIFREAWYTDEPKSGFSRHKDGKYLYVVVDFASLTSDGVFSVCPVKDAKLKDKYGMDYPRYNSFSAGLINDEQKFEGWKHIKPEFDKKFSFGSEAIAFDLDDGVVPDYIKFGSANVVLRLDPDKIGFRKYIGETSEDRREELRRNFGMRFDE